MPLAANVIVGDRYEPFLPYCLKSVEKALDVIIINDNSNNPQNPNLVNIKESALYKEGRLYLLFSDFKKLGGFHGARNLCLNKTEELIQEGTLSRENLWILYLDCDEVHPPTFYSFVKNYVEKAPEHIGIIDGYMYQFILTFRYYTTLERRHNLFFRYHPKIRWERPVHETLINLQGERAASGYSYFHYGYLLPQEDLMNRWKLYEEYGGLDFDLKKVKENKMLQEKSPLCIPFKGEHPSFLKDFISDYHAGLNPAAKEFEKLNMKHGRNPLLWVKNLTRHYNYELRLAYRKMQFNKLFKENNQ